MRDTMNWKMCWKKLMNGWKKCWRSLSGWRGEYPPVACLRQRTPAGLKSQATATSPFSKGDGSESIAKLIEGYSSVVQGVY
jgi:hypothetical protein